MNPAESRVLTINGGSSSVKFAVFEAGGALRRILGGELERIGTPQAALGVKSSYPMDNFSRSVTAADHTAAVDVLMGWIEEHSGRDALAAIGHRVVHGGPKYSWPHERHADGGAGDGHPIGRFGSRPDLLPGAHRANECGEISENGEP